LEFYRIWRIIVGNKWLLIWLPLIATCVGLGLTYVLPEQYEATALVLVRPFEPVKFTANGGDKREIPDFPMTLSAPIDAPSKTYMEVIKSTAVAVKIVDALHLDVDKPKIYDSLIEATKDKVKIWLKSTLRTLRNYSKYGRDIPASPFELAIEDVATNLKASARKDTYAFDITYRAGDPRQAAAVANMAAEIFIDQSSEAYRSEAARAREFTETQLDESHKALDRARAAILAYKNSGGTFELKSEYDEALKNVSDLENTLAKTEAKLAGLKMRLATVPGIGPITGTSAKGSPDVSAQEAEVAELKQQISTVREGLAAYPQKEARMDAITLTQHLAEESYEFFLKQYEEARVRESAKVTEIRIVSSAVPSLYPVKPLKYEYAGLSFAAALVGAIGWVLFFEAVDPRVRTVRDLDDEFGIPVLAAIPTLKRS
jgi:uncharacterized protein involved in exopolysaccharide biosynthesis